MWNVSGIILEISNRFLPLSKSISNAQWSVILYFYFCSCNNDVELSAEWQQMSFTHLGKVNSMFDKPGQH